MILNIGFQKKIFLSIIEGKLWREVIEVPVEIDLGNRKLDMWTETGSNVSRSQAVRGELEQSALKPDSGELGGLDIV